MEGRERGKPQASGNRLVKNAYSGSPAANKVKPRAIHPRNLNGRWWAAVVTANSIVDHTQPHLTEGRNMADAIDVFLSMIFLLALIASPTLIGLTIAKGAINKVEREFGHELTTWDQMMGGD